MPPKRPFSCTECSRAFTRAENLDRHKRSHHERENARQFECEKCHARFFRKDVCKRHIANCREQRLPETVEAVTDPELADLGNTPQDDIPMFGDDFDPSDIPAQIGEPGWSEPTVAPSFLPAYLMSQYIESYITNFHPCLPILHPPTMSIETLPPMLSKVVVAIGCLYSASRNRTASSDQDRQLSIDLWSSGGFELETFVTADRRQLRTTWVFQAWLLYIVYGTFTGDQSRIAKAKKMYRFMVDAVRDFELFHQKSVTASQVAWDTDMTLSPTHNELNRRWHLFIAQESVKLSLYAFYLFDFHLFASCNMRPSISSIEFEWELPIASNLWEARTVADWWQAVLQREIDLRSTYESETESAQTRSLLATTQALLSNTSSKRLLLALEMSSFATLCVVANLENLVRDFTRCYYQLPPRLSDPSAFHVLTQSQNGQVLAALVTIASIVANSPCKTCDGHCKTLWHAVSIGSLSIKISLCKPDDLLVGGIVEDNPAAGLATSVHLSLGDYVSARRSAPSTQPKPVGDDGFVSILNDLLEGMHEMCAVGELPAWEGPWISIQGLKILIILWRALRLSIAELQSQPDPSHGHERYLKIYSPAQTIVHSVISALHVYDPEPQHTVSHESVDTAEGLDNLDHLETEFIRWMQRVCNKRNIWDIGLSMAKVLNEICAMDSEAVSEH